MSSLPTNSDHIPVVIDQRITYAPHAECSMCGERILPGDPAWYVPEEGLIHDFCHERRTDVAA